MNSDRGFPAADTGAEVFLFPIRWLAFAWRSLPLRASFSPRFGARGCVEKRAQQHSCSQFGKSTRPKPACKQGKTTPPVQLRV